MIEASLETLRDDALIEPALNVDALAVPSEYKELHWR